MHVLVLAADEGLVDLDLSGERRWILLVVALPDPVGEMPCCFLGHAEHDVQLRRGPPLDLLREHHDRQKPGVVAQLGVLHHHARADAEELPAPSATERHRWMGGADLNVIMVAVRADRAVWPSVVDEPALRSSIIREPSVELGD
ncbi:MAG: hypothetical protein OXS30_03895 [Chloroflexota bacterium]|nr:hypothetical protein [Chloroflexota bacterium]